MARGTRLNRRSRVTHWEPTDLWFYDIWCIPIIDSICHLWGASPEIDITEMVVCWRKAIDLRIQFLRNSQHFLWRLSTKIRIQKMIHQCQSFIIHHPISPFTDGVKQKSWTMRLKTSRAANCLGREGGEGSRLSLALRATWNPRVEPCLPVEKFVTKKSETAILAQSEKNYVEIYDILQ